MGIHIYQGRSFGFAENIIVADRAPLATDDMHRVGSKWIYEGIAAYNCISNTSGAAIWDISGGGGGGGNHLTIPNSDAGVNGVGNHTGIVQRLAIARDPNTNDDDVNTGGVGVNVLVPCLWVNTVTNTIFECSNAAAGAAVWDQRAINYLFTTVALAEAAAGADNNLMYCVETESYYRYEVNGATYTVDDTFVLSTGDAGNTRWVAISGRHTYGEKQLTESLTMDFNKILRLGFSQSNPYAWYQVNQSSGTNVPDVSGNGRSGTAVNMDDTNWVAGKLNNCLSYNGTDESVDCGAIANWERTQSFSFETWMNTSDLSGQVITSKMLPGGSSRGWTVELRGTGAVRLQLINTSPGNQLTVDTTATGFNDGGWHHIVVTYDGTSTPGGVHIYVDDTDEPLTTSVDALSATILNTADMHLGSRDGTSLFFDGLIDETLLYEYVVNASYVSNRWNGGAGTETYPSDAFIANIVNKLAEGNLEINFNGFENQFIFDRSGRLKVGTANYAALVDSDDVVPNKGYVDSLAATLTTYLSVTATKASGSVYDVTASGVSYTQSGDAGDLGVDAATFNGSERIRIYINGVMQRKAVDAVWASATTFTLNFIVDSGDVITILS